VTKVTTALNALYPSRVRGRNCRPQPEAVLQTVLKSARSQGMRLGWRKFLRYLCGYQNDVSSWGPDETEVAKALQCAALRGRNFARCRLKHDTFRRNAILHMLEKRINFLPKSALPKGLSWKRPLGYWANSPQLTLVKRLAGKTYQKYVEQCSKKKKRKKGKEPILSFRSFGSLPSYYGRWEILPSRSKFGGPTLVEYRQGQDPRVRVVTTRDLRGIPRRRHKRREPHRSKVLEVYSDADFGDPKDWFS
jgi:hypothetical protein